ncbi:MAG: hypothetical protein VCD31_02550, partial [Alphaproteobacteria bacterium]
GEVGAVVITPLHNFAIPLLRYSIGDFAKVGRCSCGRTLPVLRRIMGRTRSMVRLPNGDEFYASFQDLLTSFDMIRQFQILRNASEVLEMKLVETLRLTDVEAGQLTKFRNNVSAIPLPSLSATTTKYHAAPAESSRIIKTRPSPGPSAPRRHQPSGQTHKIIGIETATMRISSGNPMRQ